MGPFFKRSVFLKKLSAGFPMWDMSEVFRADINLNSRAFLLTMIHPHAMFTELYKMSTQASCACHLQQHL
jgi:hypothetical protein